MRPTLSWRKKFAFSVFAIGALFFLLNVAALPFAPPRSAFWENPLMVMYPVDEFDEEVTRERQWNLDKDPRRTVRYKPHATRWYCFDPEPMIPSDGKLILHFGDSSTWGWGLSDRACAYPDALSVHLLQGVSSVNLGVPGYSSLQGRRYVEELLPRIAHRTIAVTLYFGNNDATENGMSDAEKLEQQQTLRSALQVLPLARLLSRVAPRVRAATPRPRVSPEDFAEHMRAMIALVRSFGVPVIVIEPLVHTSWPPGYLTHTISLAQYVRGTWAGDELAIARTRYREATAAHARSRSCEELYGDALEHDWIVPRIKRAWRAEINALNVPVISLPDPFVEAEFPWTFVDYCHPNESTHTQIAHRIARELRLGE